MKKRKAIFGNAEGRSYAVKIDSLDSNDFFKRSFGQQLNDLRRVTAFTHDEEVKVTWVSVKGKASMSGLKAWIKMVNPSEFYANWKQDSPYYKDDSLEVFYKIT